MLYLVIPLSLQWLKEEFLPYLERWKKSVQERKGFSDGEKKKMQISDETLLGLEMTGIIGSHGSASSYTTFKDLLSDTLMVSRIKWCPVIDELLYLHRGRPSKMFTLHHAERNCNDGDTFQ